MGGETKDGKHKSNVRCSICESKVREDGRSNRKSKGTTEKEREEAKKKRKKYK